MDEVVTHRIPLPDGRCLAVDVRRGHTAQVVLFLHSAPGSRRFDPDPGVPGGLVTLDRPGYGDSDPLAADIVPTLARVADDIAVALGLLDLRDLPVVGWSGGGRAALALAARHPQLVQRVALVGTPAPDDEVRWIPPEQKAQLVELRNDPAAAVAALVRTLDGVPRDVSLVSAGPADLRALRRDSTLRERLERMVGDAFRTGVGGLAADIVAAEVAPWGFTLDDVQAEVIGFYGTEDTHVPPAHGAWWANHVRNGRTIEVPDAGHLAVATAWDEIVSEVARRPAPHTR